MKVVHLVSTDKGGAARAAMRISKALNCAGVESSLLVLHKNVEDTQIFSIYKSNISWNCYRAVRRIRSCKISNLGLDGKIYFAHISHNLTRVQCIKDADIINLHWVSDGFLNEKDIEKISAMGKKIVWTMHDMFSFTGGCYYDKECGGYMSGCERCPLVEHTQTGQMLLQEQIKGKKHLSRSAEITYVGCSSWITDRAKNSEIIRGCKVVNIPNPIETDIFTPIDKNTAKTAFGIKTDKRIILFGAMSADADERKGFIYLKKTIEILDPEKYLLVVFGNKQTVSIDERFESISAGKIESDSELCSLYSLADIFVAPSLQENLSNAVMESLSCGTPVVAFNIGGMKDMIEHRKNGYLAQPFDVDDLAKGIETSIENYDAFSNRARKKVIEEFSMDKVGMKYKAIYDSL